MYMGLTSKSGYTALSGPGSFPNLIAAARKHLQFARRHPEFARRHCEHYASNDGLMLQAMLIS